jgi:uncharacterized cupredoxin-like copper-binding protein
MIQQIENQISEIKTEQLQQKVDESRPAKSASHRSKSENDPHLVAIVEKSASYEQLSKMASQRTRMESSIKTIEGGVKLDRLMLNSSSNDKGNSMMLENAENTVFKIKHEMTQKIKSQLHNLDKKIQERISDINDTDKGSDAPVTIIPENNGVAGTPSDINTKLTNEVD